MRAVAVILGFVFSVLILLFAAGPGPDTLIGVIGIIASVACWIHPRTGLVGFGITMVVTVLAARIEAGHLIYTAMYAIPALFAWRSAVRNRRAAERAERADRYIRQQLGE